MLPGFYLLSLYRLRGGSKVQVDETEDPRQHAGSRQSTLDHLHPRYSRVTGMLFTMRICSILSLKAVRLSGSHIADLCGVNLGPVGPSDFL